MTEEKITQLQILQQNLQNFSMQKQQLQLQLSQIDLSLSEIDKSEKQYKIIGEVMVSMDKKELTGQLEEKKESISLMLKNYEKQETRLKEKAKELQKEIVESMKK